MTNDFAFTEIYVKASPETIHEIVELVGGRFGAAHQPLSARR
jgi:hypothetical protein